LGKNANTESGTEGPCEKVGTTVFRGGKNHTRRKLKEKPDFTKVIKTGKHQKHRGKRSNHAPRERKKKRSNHKRGVQWNWGGQTTNEEVGPTDSLKSRELGRDS